MNKTLSIHYLTDDVIHQLSKGNILTDYRDINLRNKTTYRKGVVDSEIFGSMYSNQCNCGKIKTIGVRCPTCGSTALETEVAFKRFAEIDSPVYYCVKLRQKKLVRWIRDTFALDMDLTSEQFGSTKTFSVPIMEVCQYSFDEDANSIKVTDTITDSNLCGYEGLLKIINSHFNDKLNDYLSYINTSILVTPLIMRPPHLAISGSESTLEQHEITSSYKNLIYAIYNFYEDAIHEMKSESDKAVFKAALRGYISTVLSKMSGLTKSSKDNTARVMQSNRLSNSGRCTIVPDSELKVDEVKIPRHLMYEACRDEFIQFITERLAVKPAKAEVMYRTESTTDKIQQLFDLFIDGNGRDIDGKYVIINRAPTLYQYNLMCCKVILTNDYAMHIPQLLCSPFAGDFDGDEMAWYAVPKTMNSMINNEMSPRNIMYYKKNMEPLFTPSHEIMHGLIISTKLIIDDRTKLSFDSLGEAKEYHEKHNDMKMQSLITIKGKKTTLGRAILGELFGVDIDAYLENYKSKKSDDKLHLTGDNVIGLYANLQNFDDRVERIRSIQNFSLQVTTLSGSTAPKLSELYIGIDDKKLDMIRSIEKDENLSRKQKELKIRDIYQSYVNDKVKQLPKGVVTQVTEGSRGNINQLISMMVPLLNVDVKGNVSVGSTSIAQGQSVKDYENLSIENRALQDLKTGVTPISGNLTRQFVFLGSAYQYSDSTDEKNEGIMIPANQAEGRTKVDGSIVKKTDSTEMIKVRSVITSSFKEPIITKDMISNIVKYKNGSRIGISMLSSFTEGFTQKALSLKHGGNLFDYDRDQKLIASMNCTVTVNDKWIILEGEGKKSLMYPKPSNFILNYSEGNKYKIGDIIGIAYHIFNPSYKLDSVIFLCRARRVQTMNTKVFSKNKMITGECYAYNDGTINYDVDEKGNIKVRIDGVEYEYNDEAMYKFANGQHVNKLDKICSGILDMNYVVEKNSYLDSFYIFRQQMNDMVVKGKLISNLNQELVEFIFSLIVKNKDGENHYQKLIASIKDSNSLYTTLAFEDAKKTFNKIGPEGHPLVNDTMTDVVLSLIVNDKIS
jgi:hypothetical protein